MEERLKIAKELVRMAKNLMAGIGTDTRDVSQKDIRTWYGAKDVTDVDEKDLPDKWELIATSHGINGVNGCVYADKDGNVYKITKRCSNLFRII